LRTAKALRQGRFKPQQALDTASPYYSLGLGTLRIVTAAAQQAPSIAQRTPRLSLIN
jgi:hypothetical protein